MKYKKSPLSISTKNKLIRSIFFGIDGYIGRYLFQKWRSAIPDTLGMGRRSGQHFDLTAGNFEFDKKALFSFITAGITNIAACEVEPFKSYKINVSATLELVEQSLVLGITPIVFSSDYVFDGKVGSYAEDANTNPLNEYGRQKEILERSIEENFPGQCAILRLSKVYDIDKNNKTVLSEMISRFMSKEKILAAYDQIFCPISIEDLFHAVCHIQNNNLKGIFNLCGPRSYRRYDIALLLAGHFGYDENLIQKISLNELGENFTRPLNTSMISKKIEIQNFSTIEDNLKKLS